MVNASVRRAESLDEIAVLRAEIAAWGTAWDDNAAAETHRTHLTRLTDVLNALLADIEEWANGALRSAASAGQLYDDCRKADELVLHVRRLWRWYADKLDLLGGELTDPAVRMVRSADEVIWSCWKTAWTRMGEGGRAAKPPAAPIPYLAAEFAASAMPCNRAPRGIRPGNADTLLKKHIDLLPIPLIGFPPACLRRPWWLIVAAHETGHLVQDEMRLQQATLSHVRAAALTACGDDPELAKLWDTWGGELFADAFSVVLAGPAAIWAIAELAMRADLNYLPESVSLYPPPLVRVTVANEVARRAGVLDYDPGFPVTPPDDRVKRLCDCAPAVAAALLSLTGESGAQLRSLAEDAAAAFQPSKAIDIWTDNLLSDEAPLTDRELSAARFCASAGVAAWRRITDEGRADPDLLAEADRLARRVLCALPDCRDRGDRAAAPTPPLAGWLPRELARQISADMFQYLTA